MSVIEHTEKRITDLIGAAPHPGGDFYADILEVLQGRREQVETLRQQLEGAVEQIAELERLLHQANVEREDWKRWCLDHEAEVGRLRAALGEQ